MCIKLTFVFFSLLIFLTSFSLANNKDFLSDTNEIVSELRENYSIPIDSNINIKIKDINEGFGESRRYLFNNYAIILDYNDLNNVSNAVLKGLLAHETAHIEQYSKKSWISMVFFTFHYLLSEDFRIKTEKATDMITIERGYGNELLAFRRFALDSQEYENDDRIKDRYLSVSEIENILNSSS